MTTLDIYAISGSRNRETIERFIAGWVDRARSEDRGDEELMLLPIGAERQLAEWDEWEWEPSRTLTHVVRRGLDRPSRAFAVYLTPRDPSVCSVCLAFTADGHVVFGVSIADGGTDDTLAAARRILEALVAEFHADRGYIGWELPPPLLTPADLGGDASRVLYEWTRADT